jgi:hypothetical protein
MAVTEAEHPAHPGPPCLGTFPDFTCSPLVPVQRTGTSGDVDSGLAHNPCRAIRSQFLAINVKQ